MLRRFSAVTRQAHDLRDKLNDLVRQKETELNRSYQRLAQGAQEQARSGERSRILRDMHDEDSYDVDDTDSYLSL